MPVFNDYNADRLNLNGNNWNDNNNGFAFGIALATKTMKIYDNLYLEIYSFDNILFAWKKV